MKYYLGTGTEFIKTQCKEYKTLDGALKAAAKDESLVVWDEDGNLIGSLTDNVPEGALREGEAAEEVQTANAPWEETKEADGANTKPGEESDGGPENPEIGEEGQEEEQTANVPEQEIKGADGANTKPGETSDSGQDEPEMIIPQGTMRVTVVCDGTLNLRRTASWSSGNECGRASRGQSYYVKAIHTIKGKKMVETVDGIFLSGQSDHVQFEQL